MAAVIVSSGRELSSVHRCDLLYQLGCTCERNGRALLAHGGRMPLLSKVPAEGQADRWAAWDQACRRPMTRFHTTSTTATTSSRWIAANVMCTSRPITHRTTRTAAMPYNNPPIEHLLAADTALDRIICCLCLYANECMMCARSWARTRRSSHPLANRQSVPPPISGSPIQSTHDAFSRASSAPRMPTHDATPLSHPLCWPFSSSVQRCSIYRCTDELNGQHRRTPL